MLRYEPPSLKALLTRVEAELRVRHRSPKAIEAYTRWVTRYVEFNQRKSPTKLGPRDAGSFLSHLALVEHVSASTQNQALAGLLFLYGEVLGMPLGHLDGIAHAKRPKSLPSVLGLSFGDAPDESQQRTPFMEPGQTKGMRAGSAGALRGHKSRPGCPRYD